VKNNPLDLSKKVQASILLASVAAVGTLTTVQFLPQANATTYYLACDSGAGNPTGADGHIIHCYAAGPWQQCGSGYTTSGGAYWYYQNTCQDWFYCVTANGYFTGCNVGQNYVSGYVRAVWEYTSWFKWNGFEYVFVSRNAAAVEVYLCTTYPSNCAFV